jgi:hypothetical protein
MGKTCIRFHSDFTSSFRTKLDVFPFFFPLLTSTSFKDAECVPIGIRRGGGSLPKNNFAKYLGEYQILTGSRIFHMNSSLTFGLCRNVYIHFLPGHVRI